MKKAILSVPIALSLITLAACGHNQTSESGNAGKPAASSAGSSASQGALEAAVEHLLNDKKEVRISFWTGTGAANYPTLQKMVDAFQDRYPNIKVDLSNQGAIGDLTDKLTQNIVSKSTPTLSNIDAATFPEYISSQAIVDLMPYYQNKEIGMTAGNSGPFRYYLDEVKSFGPEGTMFGFPTNKKTSDVLIYNKSYFDSKGWQPPKTWDEVASYAKSIKEETGKPGFSFDNSYGDAPFKLLSEQWGSPYINADGTIAIDNEASKAALNFYKGNMDSGYFTMPELLPSTEGKTFTSTAFVKEETYMFIGAAAGVQFAVPKPEAGQKSFEVGVAPLPQKDPGHPVSFSKGEDYVIFANATEDERAAAWLLISFLTDAKQNADWLIQTGNLPIGQAMLDDTTYKQFLSAKPSDGSTYYRAAAVNAVLASGDLAFNKVIPKSSQLAQAVGDMWEAIMIGGGDVDQQLQAAADKVK
ncbi:extracellular solute-binding protein [Paenibacillus sp. MWE-103]|uniref:Extracellular solute-binding protein n=1 Tax=Paenibacillus artemisiicola TaxID=1172618 RepID=A0ABS3WDG0_9BACL|nr:extracellular solute-binding protein [Paenibacillus artemisiicola]MBO7746347.1 extracellular solute-binding protein [Paenibacillus artemisiicola]